MDTMSEWFQIAPAPAEGSARARAISIESTISSSSSSVLPPPVTTSFRRGAPPSSIPLPPARPKPSRKSHILNMLDTYTARGTDKTAAREVYDFLELRSKIIEMVDYSTRITLLRVEKGISASVAAVVYRRIPASLVPKLSRSNPRRRAYCDAVQVIDCSRPPNWKSAIGLKASQSARSFDPARVLKDVNRFTKKCPALLTILYEHPTRDVDDGYRVDLIGDEIRVEVFSHVRVNPECRKCPVEGDLIHPLPKTHPELVISHSLTINLIMHRDEEMGLGEIDPGSVDQWEQWLSAQPPNDEKIKYVNPLRGKFRDPEEIISFLDKRTQFENILPIRDFSIRRSGAPAAVEYMNLDQLRSISSKIGKELRKLEINFTLYDDNLDWAMIFDIIDIAFPLPDELKIAYPLVTCRIHRNPSLEVYLPHWRIFDVVIDETYPHAADDIASALAVTGSRECIYRCRYSRRSGELGEIPDLVKNFKLQRLAMRPIMRS